MPQPRHLLIDADILAYQACAATEVAVDWGDNYWTWHCDEQQAKQAFAERLTALMDELQAQTYLLCLSAPCNFRHAILPTYKGNRSHLKRPLLLRHFREWLRATYPSCLIPGLEGDDVLAIHATDPGYHPHAEKIVVSIDKDMKGVPCRYYRDAAQGVVTITEQQADDWHLIQTLAGDPTDGYSGCPGIGMDRASKLIAAPTTLTPYPHTLTRGPRKGQSETRYSEEPTTDKWAAVLARYRAAGLSEQEALSQARVARIVRHADFDPRCGGLRPWSPSRPPHTA